MSSDVLKLHRSTCSLIAPGKLFIMFALCLALAKFSVKNRPFGVYTEQDGYEAAFFFSRYLRFLLPGIIPRMCHTDLFTEAGTLGPHEALVPVDSYLSPVMLQKIELENKLLVYN